MESIRTVLRELIGTNNTLVTNVLFIDFTGSHAQALLLSQMWYWQERTPNPDTSYFAKSHVEWHSEIRIEQKSLQRAVTKFKEIGILETEVRKFAGTPTLHYRLNVNKVIDQLTAFCANENGQKVQTDLVKKSKPIWSKSDNPLTDISTYTITDTKKEDTPAFFSKKIDDLKEQTIPTKKERKGRGTLETYLQFVKLSKEEYNQFAEKYGAKFVEDCIEKLDNWIDRQTGVAHEKYLKQNHAACIRGWVVKAVKEDMEEAAKRSGSFNGSSNRITSSQAVNLD